MLTNFKKKSKREVEIEVEAVRIFLFLFLIGRLVFRWIVESPRVEVVLSSSLAGSPAAKSAEKET